MPKAALTERQKDFQRLGYNLKRLQGGRSAQEMADLLQISRTNYYRKLKNPESMTYEEIKRLCDLFKVSIAQFVGGEIGWCL